jgi:protease II
LAVLAFDTEGAGKSFDLIVKDLDQNEVMPVLILNTDAQVAFDRFAGFYYTQVDAEGRSCSVFRHQVGSSHEHDTLIYKEVNPEFSVQVENTLSKEFV